MGLRTLRRVQIERIIAYVHDGRALRNAVARTERHANAIPEQYVSAVGREARRSLEVEPVPPLGLTFTASWKLESYPREVIATGEKYQMFGEHPSGYLSHAPDGRMFAILTMDKRSTPRDAVPSDEEKTKLFGSMISSAGTYTLEPEKVVHHVDGARARDARAHLRERVA